MLQPLAGRLKWESTAEGIRIVVPSRFDIGPLGDTILIACIPVLVIDVVAKMDKDWKGWSWEQLTLALLAVAVLRLVTLFVDQTVLILNPAWLTMRRGPFGLNWKKTSFAMRRLHELRSVPSTSDWTGIQLRGRETVQFDKDDVTFDLVKQLAPREAAALMEKMLEIHPFRPDEPEATGE
jgi:hypothetical protein